MYESIDPVISSDEKTLLDKLLFDSYPAMFSLQNKAEDEYGKSLVSVLYVCSMST